MFQNNIELLNRIRNEIENKYCIRVEKLELIRESENSIFKNHLQFSS